jgi:hypothetical protein
VGAHSGPGFNLAPPSQEQRQLLEADLTVEEANVLLRHATEAPFCGVFLDEKRPGVFTCRLCGLPLPGRAKVRKRHRLAELHVALRPRSPA